MTILSAPSPPISPRPASDMDLDATVPLEIPTPGGRIAQATQQDRAKREFSRPSVQPPLTSASLDLPGRGLNPLVQAANSLLDLIVPLRCMTVPPDLEVLRQRLTLAIRTFEVNARAAGVDSQTITAARYALCTVLDETIAGTAWGSGIWAHRSLLVAFHNEASGGEKVFVILQRLSQDARAHLNLLELMYLCLALGLEGRYKMIEHGAEQLAALRERLQQLITQQRGLYEAELSPHWRGHAVSVALSLQRIPVWVLTVCAGILLLVIEISLSMILNRASDPVLASLHQVQVAPFFSVPHSVIATASAIPTVASPYRVADFLEPEVAKGLLSVEESAERTVISLHGDGIFESGSAKVRPDLQLLLRRVGDALQPVPGKVIVIGHTDDILPGLSSRFSSNEELSKARARSVLKLLAQSTESVTRFHAEGRGDTEPLVANDSKIHRSLNRRVDIVVLTPALTLSPSIDPTRTP